MIDINKTKEILCKRLDVAFSEVVKVEDLIVKAQDKTKKLDIKIDKQEKILVQLDNLEEQMIQLKENRTQIKQEIKEIDKQYRIIIQNSAHEVQSKDKQLKQIESKFNLLQEKHTKELNRVIPTVEELTKREQIVKQKEQDISVIERRYKKLFKVYGANFKL